MSRCKILCKPHRCLNEDRESPDDDVLGTVALGPALAKHIVIMSRGSESASADASGKWAVEDHDIATRLPSLVAYVQNVVIDAVPRHHVPAGQWKVDAFAELWFSDEPSLEVSREMGLQRSSIGEKRTFSGVAAYNVDERALIESAAVSANALKRMSLISRGAGLDPVRFAEYWRSVHATLVRALPDVERYVQNLVMGSSFSRGPSSSSFEEIDGIVEFRFASIERMKAAYASSEGTRLTGDVANFVKSVSTFLVEARRVL